MDLQAVFRCMPELLGATCASNSRRDPQLNTRHQSLARRPASLQPDIACSDTRVSCICLGNDACSYDGRIARRMIF